ncbi:MAG: VCBS repeat-containing protein [Nannocystaceae bacterium]|nr:VCBS repeat-containing protein [Nannocystaceae bacterium]
MAGLRVWLALLCACGQSSGSGGADASGSGSEGGSSEASASGSSASSTSGVAESSGGDSTGETAPTLCLVRTQVPELVGVPLVPADVDGDGALELWRMDAQTDTVELTAFAFDSERAVSVHEPIVVAGAPIALADVDGDGRDDLLSQTGDTAAWNAGNAALSFDEPASPLTVPEGTRQWIDGDGDGMVDAFGSVGAFERGATAMVMWRGDGAGAFTQTGSLPLEVEQGLTAVYATPLRGVVGLQHSTGSIGFGPSSKLRMAAVDGEGALSELPSPQTAEWSWAGAADFDGDGRIDVVLQQWDDGTDRELVLWQGGDELTRHVLAPSSGGFAFVGAFTGDAPLVLTVTEGLHLFAGAQDADGGEPVGGEVLPLTIVTTVLDLDGDGRDELLEIGQSEREPTWAILDVLPCA